MKLLHEIGPMIFHRTGAQPHRFGNFSIRQTRHDMGGNLTLLIGKQHQSGIPGALGDTLFIEFATLDECLLYRFNQEITVNRLFEKMKSAILQRLNGTGHFRVARNENDGECRFFGYQLPLDFQTADLRHSEVANQTFARLGAVLVQKGMSMLVRTNSGTDTLQHFLIHPARYAVIVKNIND